MTAGAEVRVPSAGGIYQTLLDLGLVRQETVSVFSRRTRDIKNLEVLRDSVSGIIFIDGHYVGDAEYHSGAYRGRTVLAEKPVNIDYEDKADTQRRFSAFLPHIVGKRICDFGCGAGSNGRIVIEVPHARDFLIDTLALPKFIEFTLWSQHLILHTRDSLSAFLRAAGFNNIVISGVPRFGLANRFHWVKARRPGGHKSRLAMIEDDSLVSAYTNALARIDANDTLVAIASA